MWTSDFAAVVFRDSRSVLLGKTACRKAKEKGCTAKIVIGGAAITESFSDEIGADGYSKDAAECVKLVERLLA